MSPEETQKKPNSEPVIESDDPVESLIGYVTGNWKELVTGLLIAAVIVASVSIYQNRSRRNREQAFNQLAMASSAAQLNEVVSQFPSTKAAVLAKFEAARNYYDEGNYAEADKLYEEFLKDHAKHFLAPSAKLGRVHCKEATGQPEEALSAYQLFAKENAADKALTILARLGEARCLRQMGKLQDAIAVYETILVENPKSHWEPMVESLKETASRDLERVSSAPAAAAKPAA